MKVRVKKEVASEYTIEDWDFPIYQDDSDSGDYGEWESVKRVTRDGRSITLKRYRSWGNPAWNYELVCAPPPPGPLTLPGRYRISDGKEEFGELVQHFKTLGIVIPEVE